MTTTIDSTPTTTIDTQGQSFRSINNRGGGNCQIYAIAEGLLGNTSPLNKKKHRTLRQFLLRTLRKCAVEGLEMEKEYARHFFDEAAHYKHEQSLDKFKAYFVRNKSYGNDVSLLGFSAAFQVRIEVYNYRIFPETPKNHTVPEPQSLYKVPIRADRVPEDAPVIHLMHTAYEPSVDPNQVSSHYTYLEPVADKDDRAAFTGPEASVENTTPQMLPQLEPLLKRLRGFGESHKGVVELMEELLEELQKVDKVNKVVGPKEPLSAPAPTPEPVPASASAKCTCRPTTSQSKNASLGDIVSVRQKDGRIVSFERTAYKTNPNKHRWMQMTTTSSSPRPTQTSPPRPTLVIPSGCTSPTYTLSPLSPQDQTFSSSVYYTASPGHQTQSPPQEPRVPTPTPSPQPSPQSSLRPSPIAHAIRRYTTDHPPTIIVRRSQRIGQRRPSGYTLRPQRPTKKQRM